MSPGGWRHLAGRLVQVILSRPLTPREQSETAALLREEEGHLFWGQAVADQRHGLESARAVLRRAPGRRDLARAALLHDVGKQISGLGIGGRVGASLLGELGREGRGRLGLYLRHGPEGARLLESAGSEALVVSYARHHHGSRPRSIDEAAWRLLQWADHLTEAGKTPPARTRPIP